MANKSLGGGSGPVSRGQESAWASAAAFVPLARPPRAWRVGPSRERSVLRVQEETMRVYCSLWLRLSRHCSPRPQVPGSTGRGLLLRVISSRDTLTRP